MSLDTVDKLVVFLAKRDGIDKLVKTFQYVAKLACWHVEATRPEAADRFKKWEVASGLSRKAFRSHIFLILITLSTKWHHRKYSLIDGMK